MKCVLVSVYRTLISAHYWLKNMDCCLLFCHTGRSNRVFINRAVLRQVVTNPVLALSLYLYVFMVYLMAFAVH